MIRGQVVPKAFKILKPDGTDMELKQAMVLGWCVEWLQACFLVADDIMDQSHSRRGKPCWFRSVKSYF